jgi:hypothetical protein
VLLWTWECQYCKTKDLGAWSVQSSTHGMHSFLYSCYKNIWVKKYCLFWLILVPSHLLNGQLKQQCCFYCSFTVHNWGSKDQHHKSCPLYRYQHSTFWSFSVDCGLWIAPHNCIDTFKPPFTTVHTYKWRSVRKWNSNVLGLLNALRQVVLHFFTCLTTTLLFDKVNSYSFEDFAHHLTLLSSSHAPPLTEPNHTTQCVAVFSFIKDVLTAWWLNGTSQHTARLLFCLVLCGASFVSHWQHTTLQQALLVFCTPFR